MSQLISSSDPIQLTDSAIKKVISLKTEESNDQLKLRVYVTGGGCAGFSYGFSFDENINDTDTIIDRDGITLLIDHLSFPYLIGSEIDYLENLQGARFVVNNPNATTTCGCGSSFSV